MAGEAKEALQRVRPASVGEAARVNGVTPAVLLELLKYIKVNRRRSDTGVTNM